MLNITDVLKKYEEKQIVGIKHFCFCFFVNLATKIRRKKHKSHIIEN